MNLFISNKFKYFIAVMEEGSVSKACARMHISRTPLSKAISDLEQALGLALFIRTKDGMTPSSSGTLLYNKIITHYNDLKSIENCLRAASGEVVTKIIHSKNIPQSIISFLRTQLLDNNIPCEFYVMDTLSEEQLETELHFYDIVIMEKNIQSVYAVSEPSYFDIYIAATAVACEKMISGNEIYLYHDFDHEAALNDFLNGDNVSFRHAQKIMEADLVEMMHRLNSNEAAIITTDPVLKILNFEGMSVLKRTVINQPIWFYSQWKSKNNKEALQLMSTAFDNIKQNNANPNGLPH
nr:LysR family transcriptional regulator [uncultured Enterobacter sp.]